MKKLLIAIPSLEARSKMLAEVTESLEKQIGAIQAKDQIEILALVDNGQNNIGKKRNACIKFALENEFEYICFVDDDDTVSDDYLLEIYKHLFSGVDGIGFKGEITFDGKNPALFIHSNDVEKWHEKDGVYYRSLNHLNPVRTLIANRCKFPEIPRGEDHQYSNRLKSHIKTAVFIDKILYYYKSVTRK